MSELDPKPASPPAAPPAQGGPGAAPPHPASAHTPVPVHFHHWTGLTVALAVLAAAGALVIAHHYRSLRAAAAQADLTESTHRALEQPPEVYVAQVAGGDADTPLTLPGECRAFYEATLFARINGYIQKWHFDIGDHVKAGDVLALIDTPDLDQQLLVVKAKLESLKAQAKLAQAASDFAQLTSGRFEAAAPEGVVSLQEADEKKSERDVGLAKLESAKAEVALGEADVRQLVALTGFKQVVAPFNGIVTKRFIDIGDLVTAGSTATTTPLFTLCDSEQMRVFVDVPQVARPSIHVGMAAEVTAREFPGRVFRGLVDRTAEAIDPASSTLRVEVLTPNPDGALLPGMYAQVTFHCRDVHPPVRIQASALMLLPDGPHVAVVDEENRVRFHAIKIARDLGDVIEVADGLSSGENVALNLSNEIADGQKVAPVVANAPAPAPASSAHAISEGGD